MKLILAAIASLMLTHAALADEPAEALAFFEDFAAKVNGYDQGIADLYSNKAKITTRRMDADGGPQVITQHPLKWKRIMVLAMQLGEIRSDRTEFTNVTVADEGEGVFKVKADRRSHLLCYTDKGYFMRVKRGAEGTFLIVEEYLETQAASGCEIN